MKANELSRNAKHFAGKLQRTAQSDVIVSEELRGMARLRACEGLLMNVAWAEVMLT